MTDLMADALASLVDAYCARTPSGAPETVTVGRAQANQCRALFKSLRVALREDLQKVVKGSLGIDDVPQGKEFEAGMFLACPLFRMTGVDAAAIARMTGIPRSRCSAWINRAVRFGIFSAEGGVFADPWAVDDPLSATMNFVLDAMEIAGTLVRQGERGPNSVYSLPTAIRP